MQAKQEAWNGTLLGQGIVSLEPALQLSKSRLEELAERGIVDLDTALERASQSRQAIITAAHISLEGHEMSADPSFVALLGFVSRAQAFHEGRLLRSSRTTPLAAASIVRSYSETVAALVWLDSKPTELWRFAFKAQPADTPKIGVLTNFAKRLHPGFGGSTNS